MYTRKADIIVIGAGLSGLSAAKLLQESGKDVIVLEARNRVGGRTYTENNSIVDYVDLGGSYVGPTQNRILRLADEFGVKTYMTNEVEDSVFYSNGKVRRFKSFIPPVGGFLAKLDIQHLFNLMDKMGEEIPVDAPWKALHAEEWDNMTMKEFLDKNLWTRAARSFFKSFIEVNVTSEPYEVSLLWFLWYVQSAGGPLRIYSTTNGGQERKFVGGSQQISCAMADKIGRVIIDCTSFGEVNEPHFIHYGCHLWGRKCSPIPENLISPPNIGCLCLPSLVFDFDFNLGPCYKVLLEHPVYRLQQNSKDVTVTDIHGNKFVANHIIMAIPLPLQQKITYEPELTSLRNQLIQRIPMGSVIKTFLYYKTPFWREKGFCGSSAIDDEEAIIGFTMDEVKPGSKSCGIMGFILADKARKYAELPREERKKRISELYAKVFESEEALNPIHYEEMNWMGEQWSGGCYTVMMPPGFLTKFGKELRKPVCNIHYAGTETSSHWTGYMEGAVQAGERAAREILFKLGDIKQEEIWQDEPENEVVKARPFEISFFERHMPTVPGFLGTVGLLSLSSALGVGAYLYSKYHK